MPEEGEFKPMRVDGYMKRLPDAKRKAEATNMQPLPRRLPSMDELIRSLSLVGVSQKTWLMSCEEKIAEWIQNWVIPSQRQESK